MPPLRYARLQVFYTLLHQITIVIFTTIWTALVPSVRFDVVNTFKQNLSLIHI